MSTLYTIITLAGLTLGYQPDTTRDLLRLVEYGLSENAALAVITETSQVDCSYLADDLAYMRPGTPEHDAERVHLLLECHYEMAY